MNLKPQDILILLKLVSTKNNSWSYHSVADELCMSSSEIHVGIKRLGQARLFDVLNKKIFKKASLEFLIHGVKYAFPPERGGQTRGVATSYAAYPLKDLISANNGNPPVWPDPMGDVRGYEFSPLYSSVTKAIKNDQKLYELLILVDAIRDGKHRETEIAIKELRKRFASYEKKKRRKSNQD